MFQRYYVWNGISFEEKVYNIQFIITVAWSDARYKASWIFLDLMQHTRRSASRVRLWSGNIHSTWYNAPDQVTVVIVCIYYIPINDMPFQLNVFWPSDTEHCHKLTFSESVSLSRKTRLMALLMMTLLIMPQEMSNVPALLRLKWNFCWEKAIGLYM